MDITPNQFFSLTQFSKYKNTVLFKESNSDNLFQHIKTEPKHGQRIVVFDLDRTIMNTLMDMETLDIIKKLQAERCLVIGLTAKSKQFEEATLKEFLALGLNFNQGFFKNIRRLYKSYPINLLLNNGILFVDGGGSANKKNALSILIHDFQLDPDDVYFIDRSFLSPTPEINTPADKKMTVFTSLYECHVLKQKDVQNTQNKLQDAQGKIANYTKHFTS